jgi:hypothetical protein
LRKLGEEWKKSRRRDWKVEVEGIGIIIIIGWKRKKLFVL